MNFIALVFCALAVFRLAELLVIDDGPFEIMVNIRGWLNDSPLQGFSVRRTIFNALSCVHCTGLWLALAISVPFASSLLDYFVFALAVAGLQSIIANKLGRA